MDKIEEIFMQVSDCYADTWVEDKDGKMHEGQVIPALTLGAFEEALNLYLKAGNKQVT